MPLPDINDILSGFPGPVTLRPSRRRTSLHLLGSLAFVAAGVWMLHAGAVATVERWKLWFSTGFFALGAAVFAITLLPGASKLLLDGDGFEVTSLFRSFRIRWADTSVFEPSNRRLVRFDDTRSVQRIVGKVVKGFAGRSGALPNITPFSAPDFAALLNRWRAKALG